MLGVIFGVLYCSTAANLERESMVMMENLTIPPKPDLPDKPPENIHLPYFSMLLDRNGNVTETESNFFDTSDKERLNKILQQSFSLNAESGELKEYNLRFLRTETPRGPRIIFVDMTSERSTLRNLISTFIIIGSAAFLVFLAISIFLARKTVKPIELAWRQQKQFVADASHELKTPLTVIMTDAELLNSTDCPDTDRKPLCESILTMSTQMRGLTESLLDLARMDNASTIAELETVNFSETAAETVMMFEPVFFEKGLTLNYEIEPDIRVNGISAHLKQLAAILLDNAAKYSAPGGDTYVKLSRSGHKRCLLEVSDRGEPMSKEDINNIFKRFYRADKARAMNHSYGLGLSIAQSITEEHHGKIRCESSGGYNRFFAEIQCLE